MSPYLCVTVLYAHGYPRLADNYIEHFENTVSHWESQTGWISFQIIGGLDSAGQLSMNMLVSHLTVVYFRCRLTSSHLCTDTRHQGSIIGLDNLSRLFSNRKVVSTRTSFITFSVTSFPTSSATSRYLLECHRRPILTVVRALAASYDQEINIPLTHHLFRFRCRRKYLLSCPYGWHRSAPSLLS